MTQMSIKSPAKKNGNSITINEKEFRKIGDVEMNQIETIVNNKEEYEENVQNTHKHLVTNSKDNN